MSPTRWRKKPVVIEAMQWSGTQDSRNEIKRWANANQHVVSGELLNHQAFAILFGQMAVLTLEGMIYANPHDWIIKGVAGEFYPCRPDIFERTYEPA